VASAANGFFLALALVDAAVGAYCGARADRAALLAGFWAFRHGERGALACALALAACALPAVLWQAVTEDLAGLGVGAGLCAACAARPRARTRGRHLAGAASLAALLAVLAWTLAVQRPAEAVLARGLAAAGGAGGEAWQRATAAAARAHVVTLLANIAQLPLPFVKAHFAAAGAAAEAEAARAAPPEPPASPAAPAAALARTREPSAARGARARSARRRRPAAH